MSHSTQPVRCAHGSPRKVVGPAITRKSPPPSISAMPNPPPAVKTGNTVLCAVSLASSVVVIEQPLRIAAAASLATMVFPRRMPCWSGNDRRTTSSPCSSIHLSARAAASNCSSLHKPWRSTQLRDRKSTRLNSSHTVISYAVFCLKTHTRRNKQPGREHRRRDEQVEERIRRGRPPADVHAERGCEQRRREEAAVDAVVRPAAAISD